jgi:hypothetical protein
MVGQITLIKIMKHNIVIFKEKKKRSFENMMRSFLSIKFKVSFRLKYEKKYGTDQTIRYRHQIRRNLILLSIVMHKN